MRCYSNPLLKSFRNFFATISSVREVTLFCKIFGFFDYKVEIFCYFRWRLKASEYKISSTGRSRWSYLDCFRIVGWNSCPPLIISSWLFLLLNFMENYFSVLCSVCKYLDLISFPSRLSKSELFPLPSVYNRSYTDEVQILDFVNSRSDFLQIWGWWEKASWALVCKDFFRTDLFWLFLIWNLSWSCRKFSRDLFLGFSLFNFFGLLICGLKEHSLNFRSDMAFRSSCFFSYL